MMLLADILVALIALLHVYILVLEMVLWTRPAGLPARLRQHAGESARHGGAGRQPGAL